MCPPTSLFSPCRHAQPELNPVRELSWQFMRDNWLIQDRVFNSHDDIVRPFTATLLEQAGPISAWKIMSIATP